MATVHPNEFSQAVQHAVAELNAIGWLDQDAARELGPLAEATANLFMVLFYQAETGLATREDFSQARAQIQHALTAQHVRFQ
ncbi:type I toxin-antitoxin system ptaRNA1 family toxin [Alcaligenes nematophilus]|uniref:type I toxin-antitoxin system ptaRNA1 family toxin n=1 Tax=Pseudomonadota TaxID=1224 RepID=UPI0020CCF807|nr:type I toxin-antitoxin system ptaRNA1 family toxin [Klebsiella pneumoniae]EDU3493797.1 type I toxin-antitoxin system ptaRNA1 family toxin [Salmonella enterica subsp. enterica serovar Brazos]EED4361512.1 type I toxin-antitoxin system ptaRNA1 family toxin [Salmonella enterica subsp. enterica]EEF8198876.1 type I toxin-antitoxin system ptaRNA1 family toxin [Salmonella enterica]MCS8650354.1 type I toxin-antitoxin system ptaRNA1 family toxin [Pseudomonas aeruginosa]EEM3546236.1 type I toxin-antit